MKIFPFTHFSSSFSIPHSHKNTHPCSDAFDGFNVQECGSLACLSNPCRNGAICIEDEDEDGENGDAGDESENDVHNHHSFFTSLLSTSSNGQDGNGGGDKWRCKCTTGFMGPTCEISICDNNPCQYGGTCVTFPGSGYLCLCPLGKHGHYCEHSKYKIFFLKFLNLLTNVRVSSVILDKFLIYNVHFCYNMRYKRLQKHVKRRNISSEDLFINKTNHDVLKTPWNGFCNKGSLSHF